jgi:hypothetical protein
MKPIVEQGGRSALKKTATGAFGCLCHLKDGEGDPMGLFQALQK